MATPIDVVVFKCCKVCPTENRALFTSQKKKISAVSQTVATAWIAPKIYHGQPSIFGSQCSWFSSHLVHFDGVIVKRVNRALLPRRVFPWFAQSEASFRANKNYRYSKFSSYFLLPHLQVVCKYQDINFCSVLVWLWRLIGQRLQNKQ